MAKKRKSSVEPEAVCFDSSDKTRHLEADFEKLCEKAEFQLPHGQHASPAKYDSLLWKTYKFLWWKNQSRLDAEVNAFLMQSGPLSQRFIQALLARLDPLVKLSRTPRANRFKDADDGSAYDIEPIPPSSPLQGKGLTKVFKASKSVGNEPQAPKTRSATFVPANAARASIDQEVTCADNNHTILEQAESIGSRGYDRSQHIIQIHHRGQPFIQQDFFLVRYPWYAKDCRNGRDVLQ